MCEVFVFAFMYVCALMNAAALGGGRSQNNLQELFFSLHRVCPRVQTQVVLSCFTAHPAWFLCVCCLFVFVYLISSDLRLRVGVGKE